MAGARRPCFAVFPLLSPCPSFVLHIFVWGSSFLPPPTSTKLISYQTCLNSSASNLSPSNLFLPCLSNSSLSDYPNSSPLGVSLWTLISIKLISIKLSCPNSRQELLSIKLVSTELGDSFGSSLPFVCPHFGLMQTSSYQSYLLEQSRLYQARLYQTYLPQPFFIIFCTFCTKLIKLIFISIEFTSIYLRRKFRHWSERVPRVF